MACTLFYFSALRSTSTSSGLLQIANGEEVKNTNRTGVDQGPGSPRYSRLSRGSSLRLGRGAARGNGGGGGGNTDLPLRAGILQRLRETGLSGFDRSARGCGERGVQTGLPPPRDATRPFFGVAEKTGVEIDMDIQPRV